MGKTHPALRPFAGQITEQVALHPDNFVRKALVWIRKEIPILFLTFANYLFWV
jgi:hypothetical protein